MDEELRYLLELARVAYSDREDWPSSLERAVGNLLKSVEQLANLQAQQTPEEMRQHSHEVWVAGAPYQTEVTEWPVLEEVPQQTPEET